MTKTLDEVMDEMNQDRRELVAVKARIAVLELEATKHDLIMNQQILDLEEKNAKQHKLLRATIEYSKRMNEMLSKLQEDVGDIRLCDACNGVLEAGRGLEPYWEEEL